MKDLRFVTLVGSGFLLVLLQSFCVAADKAERPEPKETPRPQVVAKILDAEYVAEKIQPPNLLVTATGEVPKAGYTKPTLIRVSYVTPPADGIQDYFLLATPPSGPAADVVSKVTARDRWKGFTDEAPWIKGIRVHGVGDGIVVRMFSGATTDDQEENVRRFEGQSNDGKLQAALDDALSQLDKALGEGGVADALATWTITGVTGQRGSIAGLRTVTVTITATRSPEWDSK